MYIIGDIGATKIRISRSDDLESFSEPIVEKTPEDFYESMDLIKQMVNKISEGEKAGCAAIGIAGPVDRENWTFISPNNKPDWKGKSIGKELEKIFECPIFLENDAAFAALGESTKGAGKGDDIVAYLTVSTGVGGARVSNGLIDESVRGFEIGHQIIDIDGSLCPQCNTKSVHNDGVGHLEGYVSGLATERRLGKKPYEIPQSDPLWNELAFWLATGINNVIVHWSPSVVVLGGSMILGNPAIPLSEIEKKLSEVTKVFSSLPALKKADLGDFSGLYGALVYLKQKTG
ncbi:MAG: hypothetical protein COV70_01555 [Parcubacteria group bacterium CG11_big_fil_rev_8_21_14_0_20_39_22]|nr:MAG: hypothetical protein COV70_01555 [Parcubacteria group bacterium CG11_big_fil_rev_8_21_14_0_20_39_22]